MLELGVRYDEELPDYILVMVVNKKSRQQMNEDLNLFLEDSTEPFVNWLHDQVLKKLQKVTVAKKKSSKEIAATAVVKKEEDEQTTVKVEDQAVKSESKTEATQHERDKEFDELVGDLALLNEEDSKTDLKDLEPVEDESKEKKKSEIFANSENSNSSSSEKEDSVAPSAAVPDLQSNEKEPETPPQPSQTDVSPEKTSDSPEQKPQGLKRTSDVMDDESSEKNSQSAKRMRLSSDSDNKEDTRVKSSVSKPRITSVVSVKTRLGVASPPKKLDLQAKAIKDIRNALSKNSSLDVRRNEINSQRSSSKERKSVERRKRNEDSRSEKSRDDKHQSGSSSKYDKSSRIGDSREKERPSGKLGTIKSRLGPSTTHKQDKSPAKSSSSTKVSKPRMSNVKSRLGIRCKDQEPLDIATRLARIAQSSACLPEKDDDAESEIMTSLRSHITALKPQRPKKESAEALLRRFSESKKDDKRESNDEDNDEEDDDPCKISSKIIVTPRPLKPLQPSQRRATQSLLLRAVAEANKSVVMKKNIDPCLKVSTNKNIFLKFYMISCVLFDLLTFYLCMILIIGTETCWK